MSIPEQPIRDFSLEAYAAIEDAVQRDIMDVVPAAQAYPPSLTLDDTDLFKEIDGVAALSQSIKRMLTTERFSRTIYDHSYGIESEDLFGNDVDFVDIEIERRITEALNEDDRILDVHSFDKVYVGSSYLITFTVDTIFGAMEEVADFGFNTN